MNGVAPGQVLGGGGRTAGGDGLQPGQRVAGAAVKDIQLGQLGQRQPRPVSLQARNIS